MIRCHKINFNVPTALSERARRESSMQLETVMAAYTIAVIQPFLHNRLNEIKEFLAADFNVSTYFMLRLAFIFMLKSLKLSMSNLVHGSTVDSINEYHKN